MLLQIIAYIPAIIGIATLSFVVLLRNTRHITNQAFALLGAGIVAWLSMLFMADIAATQEQALFFMRFAQVISTILPLLFLYFCYVFPAPRVLDLARGLFLSLPAIFILPLSYSELMIRNVEIAEFSAVISEFGPIYIVLNLYMISYLLGGVLLLFRKKRSLNVKQKSQVNVVLMGIILAISTNVVTGFILVLAGGAGVITLLGGLSFFVFSGFVSYAIVKHRMFDIRAVIARSLAYLASVVLVAVIYTALALGLVDILLFDIDVAFSQQIIYVTVTVLLAFAFQPIKNFFNRLTDRLFYRDRYYTEEVLNRLGKVFVNKSNSFELLDESLEIITSTLKTKTGYLVVMDGDEIYKISATPGVDKSAINLEVLTYFKQPLTMYDETRQGDAEYKKLRELDIYVALRLELQEGLIGYLLLSEKQSGATFTKQDVNLLEILSQELAVAIQNAKNYEEIQAFSEKLKKEVDAATAELKEKNRRLEELDRAKDDFISMASHQLRTPLTSIKGYLSMLLDGDAGKIPKKQREFIDLAFVSSQRMAHLISDLLNVSRISTGKLTIDTEEFDLNAVTQEEVEQLQQQAKARGVQLTYHAADKPVMATLDEGKIRQVIMNFTDNAIYYAPQGEVKVYVDDKDGVVELRVEDNGIGVAETDKEQLFSKFYRAENARQVRPDGTGLGLYMSKQVIEAQGGEIIFDSKEGEGSTFGFRFEN